MLLSIWEFLDAIPDVVWSGIMASMITLFGVMISNRSQNQRLKLQLDSDERRRRLDQISSLRREVYLQAAQELASLNAYIGNLGNLDPRRENIGSGFSPFFSAASKLQLVCEPATATLTGALVTRYGELLPWLIRVLEPIHDQQIEIDVTNEFYELARAESNRVIAAMRLHRESGRSDPKVLEALQHSLDAAGEQMRDLASRREAAWNAKNLAHLVFMRQLLPIVRGIGDLQLPLTVAIRGELHLGSDLEAFRFEAEENWMRMKAAMDESLELLEKQIRDIESDGNKDDR